MRKPRLTKKVLNGLSLAVSNLQDEAPDDFASHYDWESIGSALSWVRKMEQYRTTKVRPADPVA